MKWKSKRIRLKETMTLLMTEHYDLTNDGTPNGGIS